MWLLIAISMAFSTLLALAVVPVVRSGCRRLGIVDKPDAVRKLQRNSVALGGGLAVFTCVCVTFAVVLIGDRHLGQGVLGSLNTSWHVLFYSAAALMIIGLLDDTFALRGRQKLLLQILVVASIVGGGTLVRHVQIAGFMIDLGIFAYPLTVLWLLAAINALNLIDGADGMASTAGAIISGGLAVLCVLTGAYIGAAVAAALCGALIGFLAYNRPPASIYLGDAGSMVIGLFVGVISIWGSVKGTTLLSFAPMLILSLPLFDSTIAILRRVLTGRSIYATDRAHLHHRLLDRFSHPMMLLVVAALTGITSITSIVSVAFGQQWVAVVGVLLIFGILVFCRLFGNSELTMLFRRTSHFAESLLVRVHQGDHKVHEKSLHLQGNRKWDLIWQSLVEYAIDRQLSKIHLDVSIAWMQEGYHGSWHRNRMPEKSEQMCLKLPLFVDDRLVGKLEIVGSAKNPSTLIALEQVHDRLTELQNQIRRIIESAENEGTSRLVSESESSSMVAPASGNSRVPVSDASASPVFR